MAARRSTRHLEIADHLWEVLEQMSEEMGADPSVLVNQALFAWAAQHGYLKPGSVPRAAPVMRAVNAPPAPKKVVAAPPPRAPVPVKPTHFPKREPQTAITPRPETSTPSSSVGDDYLPGEAPPESVPMPADGETAVIDLRRARLNQRLVIHVEGREPTEMHGDGPFIIGRAPAAQLTLNSSNISRHHAQLTRDEHGISIKDLGSSNGTWFREEKVSTRLIEQGDELRLGDFTLRFEYR